MKIKECIDQIFESIPDTQLISIRRNSCDYINNIYNVSLQFNDNWDDRISGKVKSIYSKNDTKYVCEKIYDKFIFDEDKTKELLELSHQITMNTSALEGYALEIVKKEDNYRMTVPEMIEKRYWVNYYFGDEDYEDEDEVIENDL